MTQECLGTDDNLKGCVPNNKLNLSVATEDYGYLKKTAFDFFSMPEHDGLIHGISKNSEGL